MDLYLDQNSAVFAFPLGSLGYRKKSPFHLNRLGTSRLGALWSRPKSLLFIYCLKVSGILIYSLSGFITGFLLAIQIYCLICFGALNYVICILTYLVESWKFILSSWKNFVFFYKGFDLLMIPFLLQVKICLATCNSLPFTKRAIQTYDLVCYTGTIQSNSRAL